MELNIFSTGSAFAALREDDSVVTWGNSDYGGDSSRVADELLGGVVNIFSTGGAFAALREDGSVVTWGDNDYGGDSSPVVSELSGGVLAQTELLPLLKKICCFRFWRRQFK